MAVDFIELKHRLAEYKVFDAWQYVQSLVETASYMNLSFELLCKVYEHRKNKLEEVNNAIISQAISNPGQPSPMTIGDLNKTHIDIAGYEVDDAKKKKKTAHEFFHYARMSIEVLSQIINSALLGDSGFDVTQKNLPSEISKKLNSYPNFQTLHTITQRVVQDSEIKYLFDFDNYVKHIKTVLMTIKNSFIFSNDSVFNIRSFCYKGIRYPEVNAIDKISAVRDSVVQLIEDTLNEVILQIPNCIDNSSRYHSVKFKQVVSKTEEGNFLKYMTYFIEVENDLSELPNPISIMPLIIKPNGDIYNFVLDVDEVFITKKGQGESGIIGIAEATPSVNSNELYRKFTIRPCSTVDYGLYIGSFTNRYSHISYNYAALDGQVIFLDEQTSATQS